MKYCIYTSVHADIDNQTIHFNDIALYNLKSSAMGRICTLFYSLSSPFLSTKLLCLSPAVCRVAGRGAGKIALWLVEEAQWIVNLV